MAVLMRDIKDHAAAHGAGHPVIGHGGLGEECERELEREQEVWSGVITHEWVRVGQHQCVYCLAP